MFQARGEFKKADDMEKTFVETVTNNVESPIELQEGKEVVLGCIMLQLSLKQGLKKWDKHEEESRMK